MRDTTRTAIAVFTMAVTSGREDLFRDAADTMKDVREDEAAPELKRYLGVALDTAATCHEREKRALEAETAARCSHAIHVIRSTRTDVVHARSRLEVAIRDDWSQESVIVDELRKLARDLEELRSFLETRPELEPEWHDHHLETGALSDEAPEGWSVIRT